MHLNRIGALGTAAVLCSAMIGCSKPVANRPAAEAAHEHVHGPHDGEIIELGNEEYHAELVHDDEAHTVTVYLLDKDVKSPATTDAPELTITVTLSGAATPFKLLAKPMEGEQTGQSSRFISTEPALGMALENEKAKRELSAAIGGKTYTAPFEHFEHHHHHHDHAHEGPEKASSEAKK